MILILIILIKDDDHDSFRIPCIPVDAKGHLVDFIPITFKQAGKVYLFKLASLLKGTHNNDGNSLSNEAMIASFSGDRGYARFGMSLEFKDTNQDSVDDLVIGSPYRTQDLTEEITGGSY